MKNGYRAFGALLGWSALVLQYVLVVTGGQHPSVGAATLTFFGYFTITTNILVALAFTAPFLKPSSKVHIFFMRPAVRAAIALYILVVAVVYHVLLAHLLEPAGLALVADICLHTAIPILYILDWLVFAEKRPMLYREIPYWVIYPILYGAFTILRGLITDFYPYPFLNITDLGVVGVLINMLGFTAVYAVGGAFFVSLGKRVSQERTTIVDSS